MNPGRACAYTIGQLKILEVRDKARRFHNVVRRAGAVPLEVLEDVVHAQQAADVCCSVRRRAAVPDEDYPTEQNLALWPTV